MVDVNLSDPGVQRLLGNQGSGLVSPASGKKEMVQIAGDMDHGMMHTTNLDLAKHEVGVMGPGEHCGNVDVYAIPGEPVKVHMICPRCHHRLTINGDRQAIDYEAARGNPQRAALIASLPPELAYVADLGGQLSVSTFQCTWELSDQKQDTNQDLNVIARGSLCRWRGVIDRNVVREA